MPTVLIVDDEKDMRVSLTNILESDSYTVISASNGKTALEKLQKENPDIILLDIRMPGMDGIQTLKQIRKINDQIPVIMITGYGNTKTSVEAMKLGAVDYFSKPFNYEEVINAIRKAVEMKKLKEGTSLFEKQLVKNLTENGKETVSEIQSTQKTKFRFLIPVLILSFLFLVLITGSLYYVKKYYWKTHEYIISYSNPSALANDGENLWVSDWFTQKIYKQKLDAALSIIKQYDIPEMHLTGIALAKGYLFSCDIEKKQIYRHNMDEKLTNISSYPVPGNNPSGLFWDGKYLWSCDSDADKIYKHIIVDDKLVTIETYPSPASHPVGLYNDGEYFWSADANTNKIYKHEFDKFLSVITTYEIPKDKGSISSFTLTKGIIWIAIENSNKIYSYNLRQLKEIPHYNQEK